MPATSPGDRLTDIIFANKMTKKAFAKALGYNPSYITQLCQDIKPPTREFASKVEKRFGVPQDWLISGVDSTVWTAGHTKNAFPRAQGLTDTIIRKLSQVESEHELRAILAFINSYEEIMSMAPNSSSLRSVNARPLTSAYKVPVKGEVAGGSPIIAYEKHEEIIESPVSADSALYLKGKSMEPDYPSGCLLLIKENAYVVNGDVVVALIMKESEIAEATCKVFAKRGAKVTLSPLNPDFSKQVYEEKDGYEIKIFGKVIGIA